MSYGLIPLRLPPGPGVIAMPSRTYSGSVLPLDVAPRMRTAIAPSGAVETSTPETRPWSAFWIGSFGSGWTSFDFVTEDGDAVAASREAVVVSLFRGAGGAHEADEERYRACGAS